MTETHCRCCHTALPITAARNVRAMVYPDLYGMIGECPNCPNTQSWVIFEVPDEVLLLDGELSGRDSLSDLRPTEAA
jgi:hypothetical protein